MRYQGAPAVRGAIAIVATGNHHRRPEMFGETESPPCRCGGRTCAGVAGLGDRGGAGRRECRGDHSIAVTPVASPGSPANRPAGRARAGPVPDGGGSPPRADGEIVSTPGSPRAESRRRLAIIGNGRSGSSGSVAWSRGGRGRRVLHDAQRAAEPRRAATTRSACSLRRRTGRPWPPRFRRVAAERRETYVEGEAAWPSSRRVAARALSVQAGGAFGGYAP